MISQAAITEWETTSVLPWEQGIEVKKAAPVKKERKAPVPSRKEDGGKNRKDFYELCKETREDEPRGLVERAMYGLPYADDGEEDLEDYAYLANRRGSGMGGYGRQYGGEYGGRYGGYGCHYGI